MTEQLTTQVHVLDTETTAALKADLRGEVVLPSDANYDAVRRIWNGLIDKHPAVIARCTSAVDVMAAIRFAQEYELEVAVRGGGHSTAGLALCDDGLVIDLSPDERHPGGHGTTCHPRRARAAPGRAAPGDAGV